MAPNVELRCSQCGNLFLRSRAQWKRDVEVRQLTDFWCSRACLGAYRKKTYETHECEACGNEFSRKPHSGSDSFKYCSRACASKVIGANLTAHSRSRARMIARKCSECSKDLGPTNKSGLCQQCYNIREVNRRSHLPLATLRESHGTLAFHAKVRAWARKHYTGAMECAVCGYDRHVDICHVRAVADFPPSATIKEVNHRDNLVALCRNNHWEFDNGLLAENDVTGGLQLIAQ